MNTTTTVADLPVAAIAPDPGQPRKRFERAALDELGASLATHGLLEPIIVRPVDDRFVIIAGERRWRAASNLGWETIPALVRDCAEADAFELSMVENVVRADMNPMEEAAGYQKLIDAGMTVDTIASRLGKTAQDVRFRINLLRLDGPIADLVAAGQLGTWDAWHIARLTIEGQHRVIRAMRDGQLTKAGSVHRFALAVFAQEAEVPMFGEAEVPVVPVYRRENAKEIGAELGKILRSLTDLANLALEAEANDEIRAQVREARRRVGLLETTLERGAARQMAAVLG